MATDSTDLFRRIGSRLKDQAFREAAGPPAPAGGPGSPEPGPDPVGSHRRALATGRRRVLAGAREQYERLTAEAARGARQEGFRRAVATRGAGPRGPGATGGTGRPSPSSASSALVPVGGVSAQRGDAEATARVVDDLEAALHKQGLQAPRAVMADLVRSMGAPAVAAMLRLSPDAITGAFERVIQLAADGELEAAVEANAAERAAEREQAAAEAMGRVPPPPRAVHPVERLASGDTAGAVRDALRQR